MSANRRDVDEAVSKSTMTSNQAAVLKPENNLSDDTSHLLQSEVSALAQTHQSLDRQLRDIGDRLARERSRARELTSNMVATRRDEDRSQLASDEAVSHALVGQQDEAIGVLEALKDRPYFARVVLEEELESGEIREVEYKIGYSANPDCRIIDWRKAPLSKLYYEYREGDEYFEEIRGKERMGRIALRNQVEIKKGKLEQVVCRYGTFRFDGESWAGGGTGRSSGGRNFGALPEVLSLISPEQFRAITKESASAVLIQGIAGSGKTTVALHRLAWLLDAGNSDLAASDCLVLTIGPSLREYIRSSLSALNLSQVSVFSYREWCSKQILPHLPASILSEGRTEPVLTPQSDRPGAGVERVKRSMGLLRALEDRARRAPPEAKDDPVKLLLSTLSDTRLIMSFDESKLLDAAVIRAAEARTADMVRRGTLDRSDFALLLRTLQLTKGRGAVLGRATPFKHIVLDEVQDYSPVELATILSVVTEVGNVTLIGDTTQRIEEGFPGWDKLTKYWTGRKVESNFLKLDVSHRSTRQIVACASCIGSIEGPRGGRDGERPRWYFSRGQEKVLTAALDWLRRITAECPNGLIGVVCFSSAHAKEAYSLLSPTFGPLVRLADEGAITFEQGIVICDAYAAKGLEFYGVLVYQPVSSVLPRTDGGRALLYVASTRAQEYLAFATWGGSSPLKSVASSVLERFDLDIADEEEVGSTSTEEE